MANTLESPQHSDASCSITSLHAGSKQNIANRCVKSLPRSFVALLSAQPLADISEHSQRRRCCEAVNNTVWLVSKHMHLLGAQPACTGFRIAPVEPRPPTQRKTE